MLKVEWYHSRERRSKITNSCQRSSFTSLVLEGEK